jgi:hypothetical protein
MKAGYFYQENFIKLGAIIILHKNGPSEALSSAVGVGGKQSGHY